MILTLRQFLLVLLSLFLFSCGLGQGEEEVDDIDDGKHPEYYENESFNSRNFEYFTYNLAAVDGDEVRTTEELEEHRPKVSYDPEKDELTLTFPDFPQTEKHYWAWFEVTDVHKNEVYRETEIPDEEIADFKVVFSPAEPFRKRVRIRCYCQVHGEFIDYYDLPELPKAKVLDLDLDTDPQ